ncbi:unnamed protein product [Phyllotreta striolata]|uniref:Uncharacterized protein n=1 Tax=Phyllotreta striolata TaxID=444603 RepID=A0A9N9TN70_PHYSR|nr:unnamed protein product [Phyllotreta striolata]
MDTKKMTGEPNQNPTSVFGFDTYPPTFPTSWNQNNPFVSTTTHYNPPISEQRIFNQDPGLSFSTPFNVHPTNPQITTPLLNISSNPYEQHFSGFSFGSTKHDAEVVQFPFDTYNKGFGLRCKRKTESPPLRPLKQHITEEKMAEHMSKLHISSETAPPKESEGVRMQRLYMCEEMRKLQTDSILPQSLLSRIERPCTALVLWKPPAKLVPPLGSELDVKKSKNNDKDKLDRVTVESEMGESNLSNMDLDTC